MFERFTQQARAVVEEGARLATDASATHVRPGHLFEALLVEGGVPADALSRLGTSVDAVRAELRRRRDRYVDGLDADDADALAALGIDLDEVVRRVDRNLGPVPVARRRRPRFSRESKKALELALREAVAGRDGHLGSEHLLLGLVDTGDRLVVDTLAACGVQPTTLHAAVADVRRKAG